PLPRSHCRSLSPAGKNLSPRRPGRSVHAAAPSAGSHSPAVFRCPPAWLLSVPAGYSLPHPERSPLILQSSSCTHGRSADKPSRQSRKRRSCPGYRSLLPLHSPAECPHRRSHRQMRTADGIPLPPCHTSSRRIPGALPRLLPGCPPSYPRQSEGQEPSAYLDGFGDGRPW
ncbi:FMN reductase [NAD(P)H], partial [Dysosmobacter welbionis]